MRKTLTAIGGSLGIVIDKPILQVLGIDKGTILDFSVEDGALVIRPSPRRAASSREELEEWARSLLVRLAAASETDSPSELSGEVERFEQTLTVLLHGQAAEAMNLPLPASRDLPALRSWIRHIVERLLSQRPPSPKPILPRQVALEVLEDLSDTGGVFREITAARSYANAPLSVVAQVLWFLVAREYVEVPQDSSTIRPALDRFRQQGRIPETLPESLAESFKNGVILLRLTPAGGEHLHELRESERGITTAGGRGAGRGRAG